MVLVASLASRTGSDRRLEEVPSPWRRFATLLTRRAAIRPAWRCTCFDGEPSGANTLDEPDGLECGDGRTALAEAGLIQAHALSGLELMRQADALASGAVLQPGPVAVQAMLAGVLTAVRPLAAAAGLTVLRETDAHADAVCCADPVQLHRVLVHLVLQTLASEQSPGHVRILVALARGEAQLRILGRGALALLDAGSDRQALAAAERVLHAMGGALILEPRRAGYLPLCVALRALTSTTLQHAA